MRTQEAWVILLLEAGFGHCWIHCAPFRLSSCIQMQDSSIEENQRATPREVSQDQGGLLERAARLRKEATELEDRLSQERRRVAAPEQKDLYELPSYNIIEDSIWTFKYRFSDQPEPKEVNSSMKRTFFAGRLCLKFRADGYTEVLSHEPISNNQATSLEVLKVWGWDLETSPEDGKEYLLWSLDAKVIGSDSSQRFYFQIRHDREQENVVLKDGTVTIKQDVFDNSIASRLGLFSPKGILAQFRHVGNFAATKTLTSLLR